MRSDLCNSRHQTGVSSESDDPLVDALIDVLAAARDIEEDDEGDDSDADDLDVEVTLEDEDDEDFEEEDEVEEEQDVGTGTGGDTRRRSGRR